MLLQVTQTKSLTVSTLNGKKKVQAEQLYIGGQNFLYRVKKRLYDSKSFWNRYKII